MAAMLLGVVGMLQFRMQKSQRPVASNKQSEIIAMLKNVEAERDKLTQDLLSVRSRLSEFEQKAGQDTSLTRELSEQVKQARLEAGLTPLKGPGLTITLTDSIRRPGPDEDAYFFIIHDQDLQALVNELFAAGAEAVAVNDQRIITRSSIRCVGPSVLVNTVQLASPFTVSAIGPAKELEGGLRMPNGWLATMAMLIRSGGEVKIAQNDEMEVPAYSGSMSFRSARPISDSTATPGRVSVAR